MESELYKARSLSSCMKAAYDMFVSNIKTILRRTWLPAVLFAVLSAVSTVVLYGIMTKFYTAMPPTGMPPYTQMLVWGGVAVVFLLLSIAASVWFDAIVISLLDGASMKANLPRVIRLALLILTLTLVVSIVSWVLPIIISVAVYLCFAVAIVPTLYSSMKYLMEPTQKLLSVLGRPYLAGWRHWGYLFMLCLLAGIIVSIIYLIVNMPANIDGLAVVADSSGRILGDDTGLPGYFMPVAAFASFISSLIMIYVGSWFIIIVYYAYGHIEAKEKAKEEQRLAMKKTTTQVEPDFEEIK